MTVAVDRSIDPRNRYSVRQQRAAQRRTNVLGGGLLLLAALACGGALATAILPDLWLQMVVGFAGLLGAAILWRRPILTLYILVGAVLVLEQWGVAGVSPPTSQTPFYKTLSSIGRPVQAADAASSAPGASDALAQAAQLADSGGAGALPLPVQPVELLLLVGLLTVLLQASAQPGRRFVRGTLFWPIMIFLGAVLASFVYGMVAGPADTSFWMNAAWTEARAFVYLIITYFLACNLITDRRRLETFVWVIIVALGLKGVQGTYSFVTTRQLAVRPEAITGHEDVVFFATFFLLLAAMLLYGQHQRQVRVMLYCVPPLVLTLFGTTRRLGFIVLAAGCLVLGLSLLHTKRELLFKIAPAVIILLGLYTAVFWNRPVGVLGQPMRAFKSQIGYTSERDRLSDVWREIENVNVGLNIRRAPLTGLGFGRPYTYYTEQASLDTTGFVYWRYITHNAIFWVWMKMGLFGFIAFWYLLGSAVVLGLLTFRQLADGYLRALALVAAILVVMQIFFSYGDLGLTYTRNMVYLGAMLGMLVRLPGLDRQPVPGLPERGARQAPPRRPYGWFDRKEPSGT